MSQLNYNLPKTPITNFGPSSLNSGAFYGTQFSNLGVGGFIQVYNVSDLYYTVPNNLIGIVQYSGNSIPINFIKGSGTSFSYDTLTLNSDNISSGRKQLGMLAYVYETDQIYQFLINDYDNLWSAATASTGTVTFTDFGTIIRGNTPQGIAFISGWTGNTVEGISGTSRQDAVWKKLVTGGGGGSGITGGTFYPNTLTLDLESTGGTISIGNVTGLYISAGTYTSGTSTLDLFNSTGGTISITGITAGSGGSGGTSNFQYFISGSSPTGTINDGDRWFYTESGEEFVWITDQDGSQWVQPVSISYGVSEEFVHITGDTMMGTLYLPTISATTYQNLPGSSSSNCFTTFYATNISGCSPVNMLTEVNMLSGLTVTGNGYFTGVITATTISATTFTNLPTDIRTTGGTYSNNTFTFTNNTGGTYSVLFNTVTGLTVNGVLTVTGNTSLQGLTATTISATTYQNLPIKYYAEFSGAPSTSPIVLGTDSISIGNGAESRSTFMLSFGTNAGKNATGTTVSNFIGNGAGYDASGSTYVNFIGPNAGYGAINANSSTFLNSASGNFSTGATYSNFFGTSAGESSKDLNYSNVLGYQAGLGVTNAQNVNYFGRQSGWNATNATGSNFIGFGAGTSATNASYSNFIGFNAGTQSSSASFSNLIGFNAGKLFTGNNIGSNNIIIGTNISLPSGATNSINIGGVLFGTGTYSTTGGDPSIVPSNGKIGINVVNPVTTLDVSGTTRITGGLTASSITSTGVTTLGSGTFTKAGAASGDILLDNGSTDTPGLLMYYANNSNWGIDSNNQVYDVLSGQLLRFVQNLNEAGGAIRMALDTSGNMVTQGFVKPGAWRAGQIVLDTMLSNTEVTVSTTTIATSTSDTDFVTYSYTPTSSSSYLIIHYHLADYSFASGTGNDTYISRIKVDGSEITYSKQSTVNGNRSGVLFPLTGRYTNSSTSAKSIVVACRRDSADDSITIVNSSTSMWLRITEIAR